MFTLHLYDLGPTKNDLSDACHLIPIGTLFVETDHYPCFFSPFRSIPLLSSFSYPFSHFLPPLFFSFVIRHSRVLSLTVRRREEAICWICIISTVTKVCMSQMDYSRGLKVDERFRFFFPLGMSIGDQLTCDKSKQISLRWCPVKNTGAEIFRLIQKWG